MALCDSFGELQLQRCRPLRLTIRGPTTVVDHQLAIDELGNPGRHSIEQEAVVRREDHRARVVVQRLLQLVLGRDVQMVRRLIKEQQLSWLEQQLGQAQAALLTARQGADQLEHIVLCE